MFKSKTAGNAAGTKAQDTAQNEGSRRVIELSSLKLAPEREGDAVKAKTGKAKTSGVRSGHIGIYQDAAGQSFVLEGVALFLDAQSAGVMKIKVYDHGVLTPSEARDLVLRAVLGREPANPFTIARLLKSYKKENSENCTAREVAGVFNCSAMSISRYEKLAQLPEAAFNAGLEGKLKATHAYKILAMEEATKRQPILEALIGMDKKARREAIKALKEPRPTKTDGDAYGKWEDLREAVREAFEVAAEEDRARIVEELQQLAESLATTTAAKEVANV